MDTKRSLDRTQSPPPPPPSPPPPLADPETVQVKESIVHSVAKSEDATETTVPPSSEEQAGDDNKEFMDYDSLENLVHGEVSASKSPQGHVCDLLNSDDDDDSVTSAVKFGGNQSSDKPKKSFPTRKINVLDTRSKTNGKKRPNEVARKTGPYGIDNSNSSSIIMNNARSNTQQKSTYGSHNNSLNYGNSQAKRQRTIVDRSKAKSSCSERQAHVNETLLDKLIAQAEFELQHDPYRGIVLDAQRSTTIATTASNQHQQDNVDIENPWKSCIVKVRQFDKNFDVNHKLILNLDDCQKDDFDGTKLATAWIEESCHCHCPSLLEWTQASVRKQRQKSKKKKPSKKRNVTTTDNDDDKIVPPNVGQRPRDTNVRCPCDYNPYCIGSLGGIVSSLYQEKTHEKMKQHKQIEKMHSIQMVEDERKRNENINQSKSLAMLRSRQEKERRNGRGGIAAMFGPKEGKSEPMDVVDLVGNSDKPGTADNDEIGMNDVLQENSLTSTGKADDDSDVEIGHDIEHAPETAKQLQRIRQWRLVKTQPILDHLDYILRKVNPRRAIKTKPEDLLNIFNQWQTTLIFSNPLRDDLKATATHTPIALPPGISNLGATCYLNTQLQCLAQNKEFFKGIITWKPTDSNPVSAHSNGDHSNNNAMNSVLSELQSLLVKMVEGSQRTVTTLDFSTTLGLEHDEQQDPNEFARLLFERMHEAFQQHPSLKKLLPELFEGCINYETTCLACKSRSTRTETFMDLNLPIVQPPKPAGDKKESIPRQIYNFLIKTGDDEAVETPLPNAHADTDLQYCLNEYSSREKLDGENQYFCGKCGCKQDAVRETSISSAPPVLNVQLSRYVFDMKTYTKKKLNDRVLLPRKLEVNTTPSDEAGFKLHSETYVLCAVMNHLGSSAYRGHYVAEVQDFLTGNWYEFNDEQVTLLGGGPTCSYMPSNLDSHATDADGDVVMSAATEEKKEAPNGCKTKRQKLAGSADAYNMYYVRESFFARKTLEAFQALDDQLKEIDASSGDNDDTVSENILKRVILERRSLYGQLYKLCVVDGRAADRVDKRRDRLRIGFGPLLNGTMTSQIEDPMSKMVWVDANLLYKFLSCDRLENLMMVPPGKPMLKHEHLLCSHANPGLHPRVARKGKLLPEAVYEKYVTALAAERCLFLNEDDSSAPAGSNGSRELLWTNLNDCLIGPTNHLQCTECVSSYQAHLKSQLDKIKLLKQLYIDLDPHNSSSFDEPWFKFLDDSDYEDGDTSNGCKSRTYAYAVPKKFLTALRKKIETDLLKDINTISTTTAVASPTAAQAKEDSDAKQSTCENEVVESMLEGLDALDLSNFDVANLSDLDTLLASITCPHGKSNHLQEKNRVRWLRQRVWDSIKKLFPCAVEHAMEVDGPDGVSEWKKQVGKCEECEQEDRRKISFVNELTNWVQRSQNSSGLDLESLYMQYKTNKDPVMEKLFGDALMERTNDFKDSQVVYYPVVKSDVVLWGKMQDEASKLKKNKNIDGNRVRGNLKSLLSGKKDWETFGLGNVTIPILCPLKCEYHKMMVPIFEHCEGADSVRLSDTVLLLEQRVFFSFYQSMYFICKVLTGAGEATDQRVIDLSEDTKDDQFELPTDLIPPSIRVKGKHARDDPGVVILDHAHFEDATVYLHLVPGLCEDIQCCREYSEIRKHLEVIPPSPPKGSYGAADAPIVIDEVDDQESSDLYELKFFEVEAGATKNEVMKSLATLKAIPDTAVSGGGDNMWPRRSARKRKGTFPEGKILSMETVAIAMHHNLASVRLLLYQKNEKFKLNQTLTLVFSEGGTMLVTHDDRHREEQPVEARFFDLPFHSNDKVVKDVYIGMADDPDLNRLGNPSETLFFLRYNETGGAPHDNLIDTLLTQANTLSNCNAGGENTKKKRAAAERGFAGSLLMSSRLGPAAAAAAKENKGKEGDPTTIVTENKSQENCKVENGSTDVEMVETSVVAIEKISEPPRGTGGHASVLETLGDKPVLAEILKKLKELLGQDLDDTKAKSCAEWAIKERGSKTHEEIFEIATKRYFDSY